MKVAVTGGIAEGKSTVLSWLRELGLATASSDDIAREVFAVQEVQSALHELMPGPGALAPEKLRDAITSSADLRRQVNRIMHPHILKSLQSSPAQAVEVPLLFEACIQSFFDRAWVVTCGVEEQLSRLNARLGDTDAAKRMIASQLPTAVKISFADEVVRTDRERGVVQEFVRRAVEREFAR